MIRAKERDHVAGVCRNLNVKRSTTHGVPGAVRSRHFGQARNVHRPLSGTNAEEPKIAAITEMVEFLLIVSGNELRILIMVTDRGTGSLVSRAFLPPQIAIS